nr:ABC transporter permease [Nocardioides exalbidus]
MVLAQSRMEARLMLRNGEQLLLAIVIPVIVLVGGVVGADRIGIDLEGHRAVDVLTPGVLALAVMSTAFTSVAIATGFERRYGVIKLLGSSPLPRSGLLMGKVLALLNVVALQLVVLVAVGLALGWEPSLAHPPRSLTALVLAVALGTAAFAALGLFVAGVLRAEATLALANLVYLLLMAGGGVVLPPSTYGGAASVIVWLPSGALGEAMRSALVDATIDGRSLLVLALWAVVGTVLTARTFKWE